MRFDSDRKATKASLVTASSILQSKIERNAGANRSMSRVSVNWQKLRFGPFELSIGERILRRDGRALPLGGRALDILTYLASRPGEVIAKQELIDHVWSDVIVEEGSLRVHVAAIRKALGDGQFGNRYIVNVKGRGYSFVATVVPLAGSAETRNRRRHEGSRILTLAADQLDDTPSPIDLANDVLELFETAKREFERDGEAAKASLATA